METERNESRSSVRVADLIVTEPEYRYQDNTISLIDLVAVVVRHRALIMLGTILVSIFTLIALYIGPMVGLAVGPRSEYTAEQRVFVEDIPPSVRQYIAADPAITLQTILLDPRFVGEVYAPFEENAPADRTPERYLTMIRRNLINGPYNVEWDAGIRTLTLRYTALGPENVTAFLEALMDHAEPMMSDQIKPRIEEARETIEVTLDDSRAVIAQSIAQAVERSVVATPASLSTQEIITYLENDGSHSLSALFSLLRASEDLQRLAEDDHLFLSAPEPPIVFEETVGSRRTLLIIATTVAFFFAVFSAFVLEYIRHVRQEPEARQKISSAWRRA